MAEDTIQVLVNIAGKSYPVKVSRDEKLLVENLEKEVNEKIRDYQMTYSDIDQKDCLSMTLLNYAFLAKKNSSVKAISTTLSSLEEMLDKALN